MNNKIIPHTHSQLQILVYFKKIFAYIFANLILKRLEFKPISAKKHAFLSLTTQMEKKNCIFKKFQLPKTGYKREIFVDFQ